jgi:RES domain-containing protein
MWSFLPLSGEGAAIHGGRFNPRGVPALYLGLTIESAVAEAAQSFPAKLEPLTICLYKVDCEDILDLSEPASREVAEVEEAEVACPWALDIAERRIPRSWLMARRLIAAGSAGILAPSFARHAPQGARNLVLWSWGPDRPHKVSVHDPSGRLPRDQLSWPQS